MSLYTACCSKSPFPGHRNSFFFLVGAQFLFFFLVSFFTRRFGVSTRSSFRCLPAFRCSVRYARRDDFAWKYDRSLSGDLFGNWLHSDSSRPQLRSLRAGYAIKKKKKRRLPEGEIACRSFLCRAPAVLLPFAGTFSRDILCACALLFPPERDTSRPLVILGWRNVICFFVPPGFASWHCFLLVRCEVIFLFLWREVRKVA